jgi:hypothetical protein
VTGWTKWGQDRQAQRLQDLEDQVADLQKMRNQRPTYLEPPEVAAGSSEYFRYIVDYTTTETLAVNEEIDLSDSGAAGAFASSGVSLASNVITLPVGKWHLGVTVEATYWSAQPMWGDFHMIFDVSAVPVASLDYEDYAWSGKAPTFSGGNLYDITAADQTVRLLFYTDSGETSYLYGMVWGVQVA